MKNYFTTKKITYLAIVSCLVFVITAFLPISIGIGYLNFGDVIIFTSAILWGPLFGGIVGGIGGAIADLVVYPVYFIPTLIIKFCAGFLIGFIAKTAFSKFNKYLSLIIGYFVGMLVVMFGYFITGIILYGIAPALAQLPFDLIQVSSATIVSLVLVPQLLRINPLKIDSNIFWENFYKNETQK